MILKESETNRLIRNCLTVSMHLFIVIGAVLFVVHGLLLLKGQSPFADFTGVLMSCVFVALGIYFRKRIARIDELGETFLALSSQSKKIQLQFKDIESIRKMIRFTLSERAWFIICFYNESGKKERWLFQGEPGIGLIYYLEHSKINLKNMP